jgi:hypothetical protein
MKKLIVLLLALAAIGAVSAQTPALSASSTLSWGVDLDTGLTGFKNVNSATFKVAFPMDNKSKKGESGWWGQIAVDNLTFILSDDVLSTNPAATDSTSVNGNNMLQFQDWVDKDDDGVKDSGEYGALTACITNGTWKVSVSSKNSFDFANADALYDGDVAVALDADTAGTTLSYASGALGFGVTAASKGDWTANASNEYSFGANLSYKLTDALTVTGAAAYDLLDTDNELGFTASAVYSADPLTVSVYSDMLVLGGFNADALFDVAYTVMEGLDAYLDAYYSMSDDDVEVLVGADYAVDPVEAGVWFGLEDPLTGIAYDFGVYGGYTVAVDKATSLYVYAEYTSDFTGSGALVPYAKLTNTAVANTTLCLEYNAGDQDVIAGKFGTLVASAKVTL